MSDVEVSIYGAARERVGMTYSPDLHRFLHKRFGVLSEMGSGLLVRVHSAFTKKTIKKLKDHFNVAWFG